MNQNNQLTDKKNNPKNTKKRFFILVITGIIILITLLGTIFLVKKANYKNQDKSINEKETNSETNNLPPLSPNDKKNCPYLNESELTTPSQKRRKLVLRGEDLTK